MSPTTTTKKRIAILCPYPHDTAPGQRFRYEQYLDFLAENGYQYSIFPFLDKKTNEILYQKGKTLPKIIGVLKAFSKRLLLLFKLQSYDFVFVYREAALIGPPILEWVITKVLGKKMIVDFDDAIWIPRTVSKNPLIAWLRNHQKTAKLCTWAHKVSCGNEFLSQFARQYNQNVVYIPTTIDLLRQHNRRKQHQAKKTIVIGWTGSVTTMVYLPKMYPILQQLSQQYVLEFHIISNAAPETNLPFIKFIPWNRTNEIDALLVFDIGIMPMDDTIWEQGKCGFKALQYMAVGIPAVVSPVGVNADIVEDGVNGFWASNSEEWLQKLHLLIESVELRQQLGEAGHQTVKQKYSVRAQQKAYLELFK